MGLKMKTIWSLKKEREMFLALIGASGKGSACQFRRCKRCRYNPWVKKILWRRAWKPTPVSLPGESHGQRSLVGYSPWGYWESDTTESLSTQQIALIGECHVPSRDARSEPEWRCGIWAGSLGLGLAASQPWTSFSRGLRPRAQPAKQRVGGL